MTNFLSFTVLGIVAGAGYAIAALGLVVTYTTSKVFNLAHGSIGMVMSFVFWEIAFHHHVPSGLALVLVVLVIAPLIGVLIERIMMRGLADAPVSVSLVVTVGLLVLLIGVAQTVWPPSARFVPGFFAPHGVHIGRVFVAANDFVVLVAALVVVIALYALLNRTRLGIAMRATVDNGPLLSLHGARPQLLSSLSWGIGASLAALAGILLTPTIQLDYYELTLLVISAYAAAMLGRLESLPRTFVGAMLLGLAQNYAVGYLPSSGIFTNIRPAIPTIFLFALLLLLPQTHLRIGQIRGIRSVPVPTWQRSGVSGVALVGVVLAVSYVLSTAQVADLSLGVVYALIMLSLVLLTGYGGFVSLGQFSFVGIGALVVAKLNTTNPVALLVATAVAGAVGALIALPVLRLRGLYLALATLGFAELMDKVIFQDHSIGFGFGGSLPAKRIDLFGYRFGTERAYLLLITVAFVLVGMAVLALRRGRYGRLVIAVRDSPAACGTLGLSLTRTRVGLFALSAAIAGLAGGLYAGLEQNVGPVPFQLLESLPLLLLAVVGGITSVSGAALGGLVLMLLPILQSRVPSVAGFVFLLVGAAAVSLGRNPNGVASFAFALGRQVRGLLRPLPPSVGVLTPSEAGR